MHAICMHFALVVPPKSDLLTRYGLARLRTLSRNGIRYGVGVRRVQVIALLGGIAKEDRSRWLRYSVK